MYDIVNSGSKFLKLSLNPTLLREGKLKRILRALKNNAFFTKKQYANIHPCVMKPDRIYETSETHKLKSPTDELTFRPMVSFIGTYNYKLVMLLTCGFGYSDRILRKKERIFISQGKYLF